MDGEHKPEESQASPPPPLPTRKPEQGPPAPATPPIAQHPTNVEKQMTGFEKATLQWAKVAVFLSALAAAFVCAQWLEMHAGGKDTHDLAVAAGNQATWTQRLADSAKIQSDKTQALADRTKDLADRMKDQADQTKAIAVQAIVQARAAQEFAAEAANSVRVARDAMYLEQRPWVGIEIIDILAPNQSPELKVVIQNSGKTPALQWRDESILAQGESDDPPGDYDFLHAREIHDYPPALKQRIKEHPEEESQVREMAGKYFATLEALNRREQQTLPPGGTSEKYMIMGPLQDHLFHFVIGKLVYRDPIDPTKEHTTNYCLVAFRAAPLRLCKSGQDMN